MRAYERGGAAALSILTEAAHFGGSLGRSARGARGHRPADPAQGLHDRPYQLYEAAAARADAVLLIVAALDRRSSSGCTPRPELDLDCLVEVHDAEELEAALDDRRRGDRDQQPRPDRLLRRPEPHVRAARRRAGRQDGRLRERHLLARAGRGARAGRRRRRPDRRDADALRGPRAGLPRAGREPKRTPRST